MIYQVTNQNSNFELFVNIISHQASVETANDYTKRNFVFRLHAPDGSEFLFGADSEEQQEEWVSPSFTTLCHRFFVFHLFSSSLSIWWILSRLDSGEEDKVPRWVATQPTADQLQGFWWDIWTKCGEILFRFLLNFKCSFDVLIFIFVGQHQNEIYSFSGSKFWAVVCKHPSIGTQQLVRVTGNNKNLVENQFNAWLLNSQKSGPNSPPLPETMPPPSWGAQGTRDVRHKSCLRTSFGFTLVLKIDMKRCWRAAIHWRPLVHEKQSLVRQTLEPYMQMLDRCFFFFSWRTNTIASFKVKVNVSQCLIYFLC